MLVAVKYIRFAYPANFREGAVAYASTFAASAAAPGSVRQVMADAAQQSVDDMGEWRSDGTVVWYSVTYSFVREDFLPTFVPYLRGLYRPTLTRAQAALVGSILRVAPNPPVVNDPTSPLA